MYSGDIEQEHLKDAEIARVFFEHPSEIIRKWAKIEYKNSKNDAEYWKRIDEELYIE